MILFPINCRKKGEKFEKKKQQSSTLVQSALLLCLFVCLFFCFRFRFLLFIVTFTSMAGAEVPSRFKRTVLGGRNAEIFDIFAGEGVVVAGRAEVEVGFDVEGDCTGLL